ncbi:MAG TPA: thiamine pyrophosphate-dependent enzyme [Vitreimonas sp.]|nr:thiamine pyrophosphate-dependent enzyme [Vitreimonas sp.]
MKRALVAENIPPHQVVLCFDIGCNGNGSDKIGGYRVHGLHGRAIPLACGASNANSKVKVIGFGGDGGTLGEGINHLVHAIRGNYNVTFVLHNNLNYGLTQGQASSTTKPGMKMNSAPDGITSDPLHPMNFVLSLNASFAARTFSGDVHHMTKTFQAAVAHQGFAFVEVLQSCPTYNKATPHEWYQERVYDVANRPDYDSSSLAQALAVCQDIEEHLALGVLYQDKTRKPFMQRQANRLEITTELVDEVAPRSVDDLVGSFR